MSVVFPTPPPPRSKTLARVARVSPKIMEAVNTHLWERMKSCSGGFSHALSCLSCRLGHLLDENFTSWWLITIYAFNYEPAGHYVFQFQIFYSTLKCNDLGCEVDFQVTSTSAPLQSWSSCRCSSYGTDPTLILKCWSFDWSSWTGFS